MPALILCLFITDDSNFGQQAAKFFRPSGKPIDKHGVSPAPSLTPVSTCNLRSNTTVISSLAGRSRSLDNSWKTGSHLAVQYT